MKVIVGFESSGVVGKAFQLQGYDVVTCDLLPTEKPEVPHIQGDIRDINMSSFDLGIFHPECRFLANSGVRWLYEIDGRWEKMKEAARFFKEILEFPIPRIAVENPVMHGYAVEIIGRKQDQCIQPWQFGEDASKRTCFWLKNLPPLKPTKVIHKELYANQTPSGQNKLGPSEKRAKLRARTYEGIAEAMAEQWGGLK